MEVFGVQKELDVDDRKFPQPYRTLPGRNLVSQGVADLNNSEGKLSPGAFVDALEFHEDSLGCLGTTVTGGFGIGADCGGEHGHKLFSLAEVSATFWAVDVSFFDFVHQLLKGEFLGFCIAHPCKLLK